MSNEDLHAWNAALIDGENQPKPPTTMEPVAHWTGNPNAGMHTVPAVTLLNWLAESADLTKLDDVGPMTAEALREALQTAVEVLRRS